MSRPFPLRLFLFAFLGWTFDFYDLALYGFIKDVVSSDLHVSHAQESWLIGVALGTSGLGGIIAGLLADRYGRRRVFSVSVLAFGIASLLCGLACVRGTAAQHAANAIGQKHAACNAGCRRQLELRARGGGRGP